MNINFAGTIALVTGGTGGLGRAVSRAFLDEGAKTIVTYQKQEEFDSLLTDAGKASASLEGHRVDVTDEAAVTQMVKSMVETHGRIDTLINTVGAFAGGIKLWQMESKIFEQMLALNLRSGYILSRAIVPVMLKQGRGSIVNIASKAAVDHAAGASAYASSKAAAVALIDSLAADLKGTGVRANSVLPSIIDTAANRKAMPSADFSKWPKPEEIAQVILFLCSDQAKLIQGAAIPVYGDS